jgi:type VI secretion system secreted protein VgrG
MGRVKVKFHWDHSDTKNDTSSCWVRVSQTWAGNGWGSLFIPRIGQEVIINYLDGNPDRPIITGCVYNGERATPVDLPKMQTQSVLRSRPTKTGNGISKTTAIEAGRMHGNEIRFEDKKGDEELYFHAERDLKIDVEDDLETTLYKGSEEHLIKKGDRTIEVTQGNESHSVGGMRDVSVTGDETHENTGNFSHAVKKNYTLEVTKDMLQTIKGKSTIKVTGDLLIDVTGSITFKSGTTISMTSGTATTIKAGTELKSEAGTSFGIKAGTDLKAEALSIAGKASASAEINGGGMLTLKGGMVKIN